jgi:hypothetical protein
VRLIKTFGLAAVAAVAAMAFVGASSAMAEFTLLCKNHNSATSCSEPVAEIHVVANDPVILSSLGDILCESSLGTGEVLGLGAPQVVHMTFLVWTNCSRSGEACTVSAPTLGLMSVLRTALNLGTVTPSGGVIKVVCGSFISCKYTLNSEHTLTVQGALHSAGIGHGEILANEIDIRKAGFGLCPSEAKWDARYEPLEHVYIVS